VVTPRLGLGYSAGGALTPLPGVPPARLPFAGRLGPVRTGMRGAVLGGTASLLQDLPFPAAAKTGTAEDATNRAGASDSWFTAVAPYPAPSVVVTSYVHGGGHGAQTSGPVVDRALRYFWAHRARVLGTG
jgi:cell division protein FtsI/penicillin-binding protein 2